MTNHAVPLSFLVLTALLISTSAAQLEVEQQTGIQHSVQDDDQEFSIRVEINNGVRRVWVNGEEIPEDRIIEEDGRIIILDENGNPIHENPGIMIWQDQDLRFGDLFPDNETPLRIPRAGMDIAPPVMLGIYMKIPTEAMAEEMGLDADRTTIAAGIMEDLPAARAGMEPGDVIVAIDGEDPASPGDVINALRHLHAGDTVVLSVRRGNDLRAIEVELDAYDIAVMENAEITGESPPASSVNIQRGEGGSLEPDFFNFRFDGNLSPEDRDSIMEQMENMQRMFQHQREEAGEEQHDWAEDLHTKFEERHEDLRHWLEEMERHQHDWQERIHEGLEDRDLHLKEWRRDVEEWLKEHGMDISRRVEEQDMHFHEFQNAVQHHLEEWMEHHRKSLDGAGDELHGRMDGFEEGIPELMEEIDGALHEMAGSYEEQIEELFKIISRNEERIDDLEDMIENLVNEDEG